jgi:hypothetical protein
MTVVWVRRNRDSEKVLRRRRDAWCRTQHQTGGKQGQHGHGGHRTAGIFRQTRPTQWSFVDAQLIRLL